MGQSRMIFVILKVDEVSLFLQWHHYADRSLFSHSCFCTSCNFRQSVICANWIVVSSRKSPQKSSITAHIFSMDDSDEASWLQSEQGLLYCRPLRCERRVRPLRHLRTRQGVRAFRKLHDYHWRKLYDNHNLHCKRAPLPTSSCSSTLMK